MNVLTWHGAVVCADMATRRLVHVPLWHQGQTLPPMEFAANALYPHHELLGGFHVDPGPKRRTIHIRRGTRFLGADPDNPVLLMDQETAAEGETFLLLEPGDLADLRHLFTRRWRVGSSGIPVRKSSIVMRPGFHLDAGPAAVDLTSSLPLQSPARFLLADAGGSPRLGYVPPDMFLLRERGSGNEDIEFEADLDVVGNDVTLRPGDRYDRLMQVDSAEEFAIGRNCRVELHAAAPVFMMPPLLTCDEDRALFISRQWRGGVPELGMVTDHFSVRRESQRFVALMRGGEGVTFSAEGATHDAEPLGQVRVLPRGFTHGKRGVVADLDYLGEMPRLPGSYFIFYDRKLDSWFHWLAGAMLALDMAGGFLPPKTKLLLPPSLMQFDQTAPGSFDHFDLMTVLGFDRMPAVEAVTDCVQVEEAIVLETQGPEKLPAECLRAFRDRMMTRAGGRPEKRRRLFIKRTSSRTLDAPGRIEAFLTERQFEIVVLDRMSIANRIKLFQEAEIVVGAHGAELANLLFCAPGTRVIELMPDVHFRPAFWAIANKLGLVHGMLGCATHDGTFDGRLIVDQKRFGGIYRMVTSYR
jgi:hypothetical protein